MIISNNTIHNLTSTNSLVGITLIDAVSVTVRNNFISLSESNFELFGISQQTSEGAEISIYHNTVYISGTASGTPSMAFFKNWSSTDDEIYNNIFINNRLNASSDNFGQYAFVKVGSGTYKSDYNNLVSVGNSLNYVGNQGATRYSTLSDWQGGTNQDTNSISVMPVFVSPSDLHLVPDSNGSLDNFGKPLTEVNTDIDGDVRSTTTPDMGADEFFFAGTAVKQLDESMSDIMLVPNLINSNTTLHVLSQSSSIIRWSIVDTEGKVIFVFTQEVSSGQNDFQLNLHHLGPGTYQLIGQTRKGWTEIIRFIKCK